MEMNRRKFLRVLGFGGAAAVGGATDAVANRIRSAKAEATKTEVVETDIQVRKPVRHEIDYKVILNESVLDDAYVKVQVGDEPGRLHPYGKLAAMSHAELVQYFRENP